jgi:hypothetical protein
MNGDVLVVGAVFVFLVVLFLILRFVLTGLKKSLLTNVDKKLAGTNPLRQTLGANFFGQRSKGAAQIRGNGALVLTESELFFFLAAPRREFSIPLNLITSVTLPKSHLGRTVFRPLLCVEYRSHAGADAIAWAVKDPDGWKTNVEEAVKSHASW